MIPDINELNFPKKDGKQYATLTHASIPQADMGEKTITTQVKIDGDIIPDFSFDWEVAFQGEKYIMPLRIPQGSKENTSLNSTIDLTFQHWAIYQLKRWPFVTIQQIAAGTYLPDEEVATVQLNLGDFCELFGQVLEYYYGGAITIDLNPAWQYKQEATIITISHTKIWNVLIDAFHDKYGVRWEIKAASDNSNTVKGGERYVIRVGYPTTEVDHIFEYGFEGGLLKVERQVQSEEIRNMLKGRGGETNIPLRYFKNTDPNNPDFRPDPDWVEELANIPFTNLMPATFRSYVQGWKAAHISKYPGYTAVGESNAYSPWAYRKGYTDTKFHPVEFVADEITINPGTGDKQVEILPGYSPYVKKGSSLDKYGPLPDTLDNNDEIYPTLQGTGLDIAVDVEQIKSDDVAGSTENDARIENKTYPDIVKKNVAQGHATAADASRRTYFTVPTGKKANIEGYAGAKAYNPQNNEDKSALIAELDYTIKVFNVATGVQHGASGIPAGNWYFTVEYSFNNTSPDALNVTLSFNSVKITSATPDDKWRNTFDIWVKNIWDSTKLSTETDTQYAERVWKPVLGDREKNTAKVVFTSGALVHEDYEFTIVDFPVPDTSKTYEGQQSHWRITLAKSDAELKSTGLYIPSTKKQGKAGDTFVFIGTEMTHVPYVTDAEERLDDWKKDQLGEVKEIKPTAVVTTDRVRLNNEGKPDALINQLRVGNSVRLFDKRFFNEEGKAYETLYLQSITYTYREPTSDDAALNPDVEIVLGNEYITSANPVSMMQSEISALQRQVGAISNIEQIVRAVGDRLYLHKGGIPDRSLSPTQFFSLLTSGDFRAGMIGGAGWGFYKDENGNWVLEADRVNVRQEMQVNTLVINQAEGRGGMEIDTAAYIDGVTRVVETDSGYVCYFDQKGGSVANLFHVDDVAFCNRWTPENAQLKYYKRRVTAVGTDNVTLSKTDVNGTGIPAEGDNIIHFGNYTDATRQYVKVRDVVGGGYERYIEALNSVNAAGVEYYFVGKQAGQSRWFVGNKDLVPYSGAGDGSYIEYINRKFNLNNVSLSINTTIGDKTLAEYIQLVSPPVEQEDIEGFVNAIVDPKLEGIQNQIDGVIESFFGFGAPTLNNYPANEWTTDEARKAHERDTYTDKTEYVDDATTPTAGQSWKWQYTSPTDCGWVKIADSDAVKALLDAAKAQDTADSKRRTFTAQPVPPYDKGDLWVNATYGTQYSNDILRCITAKATGAAFAIGDWTLASKYTDDTLAQAAKDAADAAQNAADAAQSSVDNLNTYVDGAFKDGIITAAEASGIANYINTVNTDKERIAATYATLSNNAYLPASAKAPLKSAYDAVMSAINALISAINSAIADNKITPAEATAVNNAFATFNTANGSFSTAVENADKAIQDVLKNAADAAKTAADNAQAAADAAKGVADAAKDRLDNWAADGVISPTEKQAIRDEMVRIAADKAHIDSEFARYGLTDNEIHTAYKGCYNTYLGQLQALASTAQENNTIPSDFEDNQTAYYYARTLSLALIAAEAKKYAEEVAKQEAQNAVAGYEYLKNALPQDTQIIGGLLMSTLISLGYTDAGNVRHTMAGMNGAWVDALGGRTIGSWWGGPMVDLFDANDAKKNLAAGTYATSMVRMDGSAYFAGGNIGFRANGSGWLGNDLTGIKFDANGGMTFGSGVTFNVANVSGLKTTLDSLANFNLGLNRLLSPCNANDEEIPWEEAFQHDGSSDPNAIKAKSLKAKVDFWSTGGVTALGKSAGGSGGSGGSGGGSFGLMKVWPTTDPGSGTTDALGANLGWELRQDVLSLKSGSALSVVTAGSGNAITDIVKSGTTVTATKGATFLTQHQPLDYLNIKDVRDAVRPPTYFDAFRMSAWFNATGMPTSAWYSGIHMKGWSDGYASWQLAANSTNNTNDKNLYFRVGINATWESWQKVLTDANYSSVLNGKYVTLDTAQTITADKTFNAAINIITNNAILFPDATTKRVRTSGSAIHGGGDGAAETDANLRFGSWYGVGWYNTCVEGQSSSFTQGDNAMWLNVRTGHLYVQGGYHVKGGTASQFLKADGSVDSNSYALASALGSYYTKAESDGRFAKLQSPNNLVHSGSEITMIPNGFNSDLWFNHKAVGGTGHIEYYYMGDGNAGVAGVVAKGFVKHGSSNDYILLGGGGYKAVSDFLLRSGGSMTNTNVVTNLNADMVDGKHNGELSAKTLAVASPTTIGVTVATAKANLLNAVKGSVFGNVAKAGQDLIGNWDNDSHTTVASSVYSVINVTPQYDGSSYGQYLLFHYGAYNPVIIGRQNGAWTSVKTLAFTTDNVASATKLATARTINGTNFDGTANIVTSYWGATRTLWGQSCNGSGNVSGTIHIRPTTSSFTEGLRIHQSTNGNWAAIVLCGRDNTGDFGTSAGTWGIFNTPNYDFFINRGSSNNHTGYEFCNIGGNWGIGTTSPAYKLDVSGQIRANVATGTAPFVTPSTTLCANLNADLLDGYHGDDYFKRSGQFVSGADALQQFGLGVYLNATGNGAGNTNFPESYGVLSIFSAGTANYTLRLHAGTSKQLKYQIKFDSVNSEWMTLARITDNVASATKLQTARTIWGQTFNGTANVSGTLTGVTDIIASGDIKAKRLSLNNGASYIEWDAANNAYKVNGNFYATGGSSCLGFNYLSATEVSVGTLNADIVKGNTLAIGGHGLIMASDDALAFIHGGGGSIAFGSTIRAYEGIILGDGSYTIDEVGVASLSDVSVLRLTINNAEFTVSGNEIYVTIGSTRYKLTKTTA